MKKTLLILFLSLSNLTVSSANEEAYLLYKQEKYGEVIDQFERSKPKSFEDFETLIYTQLEVDVDDAEEAVEDMLAALPEHYRAHLLSASVMGAQASNGIFGALGYAKKAKKGLEKAIELAPDNIDALNGLISFHLAAPSIAGGDKDEARKLVEKIKKLDAKEGQFAEARYLMSTDESESAESILNALAEQEDTKARALFVLAGVYNNDETREKALEHYRMVLAVDLKLAELDDKSRERHQRWNMLANYRIGQLALAMSGHSQEGIAALTQYINEYQATDADVYGMPSLSWARLRLIELLLNAGDVNQAKIVEPQLNDLDESRYKKIRKKLVKRIDKV